MTRRSWIGCDPGVGYSALERGDASNWAGVGVVTVPALNPYCGRSSPVKRRAYRARDVKDVRLEEVLTRAPAGAVRDTFCYPTRSSGSRSRSSSRVRRISPSDTKRLPGGPHEELPGAGDKRAGQMRPAKETERRQKGDWAKIARANVSSPRHLRREPCNRRLLPKKAFRLPRKRL